MKEDNWRKATGRLWLALWGTWIVVYFMFANQTSLYQNAQAWLDVERGRLAQYVDMRVKDLDASNKEYRDEIGAELRQQLNNKFLKIMAACKIK